MSQLPKKPSGIPHLNLDDLDDEHLHAKITSIGLVAHFSAQGICDERWLLAVPRRSKQNPRPRPHRCNHFSLWLFTGDRSRDEGDAVMVDISTKSDPWFAKAEEIKSQHVSGCVRVRSEKLWQADVGCVFEEFRIVRQITPYDVINLIHTKGLNYYQLQPDMRRQVGCRHWLRILDEEIEAMGWVPLGHARMFEENMLKFYDRTRETSQGGRWRVTDGWQHTPEEDWVDFPKGRFLNPGSKELDDRPVPLRNGGKRGKVLFVD